VRPILEEYDFIIIQPEELDFVEQLNLYSKSSIILGVRGSSLHSMMFAKNANVGEIFPPEGHTAQNYVLANELHHTYWYLTGEKLRQSEKTTYGYIPFRVDPDSFRTWIRKIVKSQNKEAV
jgi:capsular polysaccharide biosynthesis protein